MILGALAVLLVLAALGALWAAQRSIQQPRPIVSLIIDLIGLDKDWQRDRACWYHPSGVGIWVANEDYGLTVRLDAKSWDDALQLGPRNLSGSNKGASFTDVEYRMIWKAIEARNSAIAATSTDQQILKLTDRIQEMYNAER